MDRYVEGTDLTAGVCSSECSRPENFAYADQATAGGY